ncbi:MAG: hypothetical protein Q7S07_01635 [Candidatus Omnitrophota bacterium]|nr:hypothetical protein [Candidatus Omnitrophota bacterium]
MKQRWTIAVWVLVALFALSAAKDLVIKVSVEKGCEFATGLKIGIDSMNVGIFRTSVRIKGLKVFNPRQFKDRVMADMPEIYVDYDLPAIFAGNIHLRDLRIKLKKFVVVKNESGELNLNSLKVVKAGNKGVKPEEKSGKAPNIRIDSLELMIDKAFYKDYSKGPEPSVKEFNVNLNGHYTNITNPYALVSLIVVKAMANTSISGLANFDINGLKGTIGDALSRTTDIAGKATGAIGDIFKNITGSDNVNERS